MEDFKNTTQEKLSKTETLKSKVGKTVAATVLAVSMLASNVQAKWNMNDLLEQCDFNWDWRINTWKEYREWKVERNVVKKERMCKAGFELKQAEASLKLEEEKWKKLDKDIGELDKDIGELDKDIGKLREIKDLLVKK